MKCPDCHKINRSFTEYCSKCGADLYFKKKNSSKPDQTSKKGPAL